MRSISPRAQANFRPLTPLDFLERSVSVYPDRPAVIWHDQRLQLSRVRRPRRPVRGDAAPQGHRGWATRLDHGAEPSGDAGLPLCRAHGRSGAQHHQHPARCRYRRLHPQALARAESSSSTRVAPMWHGRRRLACDVVLVHLDGRAGGRGEAESSTALTERRPRSLTSSAVADEWQPICLNYTSGTTGRPKGVVYHHRGAYLNALGNVLSLGLTPAPSISGRCRCSTATAGATPGR